MMENRMLFDVNVSDITVISGIRPYGRGSERVAAGRSSHGLLYIFSGEATFWCNDGERVVASAGHLAFIPKGKHYRMKYTADSTTFVLVNFDTDEAKVSDVVFSDDITIVAKDDELYRIAKIMTGFELCGATKTLAASLRKKELFYRLLGCIVSLSGMDFSDLEVDPKIAAGVQLLKLTYLENLPITRFSDECHLNINTFRNLFHKQFGVSPVKYRNRLRLERSRELLEEGSFTIAEVAYACGFENVGYFCRCYRTVYKETPSGTKKREL